MYIANGVIINCMVRISMPFSKRYKDIRVKNSPRLNLQKLACNLPDVHCEVSPSWFLKCSAGSSSASVGLVSHPSKCEARNGDSLIPHHAAKLKERGQNYMRTVPVGLVPGHESYRQPETHAPRTFGSGSMSNSLHLHMEQTPTAAMKARHQYQSLVDLVLFDQRPSRW